MKFNCDRCKTRYSISDERVRGKVLKIRCKNCSAVITVREGMAAAAPPTPRAATRSGPGVGAAAAAGGGLAAAAAQPARAKSESALRGAFDDAMKAPAAADSMTGAPAQLTTEWYLAIDGDQSGPFDLEGAKGWIHSQPATAELYCWSEGFDDWLPIEKVSQFRGMRNGANGARPKTLGGPMGEGTPLPSLGALANTGDRTVEREPQPLFAATMKQVAAEAPTLLEDDDPMSPTYKQGVSSSLIGAPPDDQPSGFELDIGEASRVVNLASLVPPNAGTAAPVASPAAGLPGMAAPVATPQISGVTSPEIELPRPEVLPPKASGSRILIPLLLASGVLVVVLGVLLFLAFSRSSTEEPEISRGGASGTENLATQYDPVTGTKTTTPEKGPDTGKTTTIKKNNRVIKGGGGTKTTKTNGSSKTYTPNPGEVDLSGGTTRETIKQGSLDPGDISSVYRKKQFSVNRCYERAIKRNPLLKVGKTYVTLEIATSGSVSKVSIPTLSGEQLGGCLVTTIGRWRFPKSTEGFRGSFPILFKSN